MVTVHSRALRPALSGPPATTRALLAAGLLPPLYVVYSPSQPGKDSGGVHSYVKQRWIAGDPSVR
jgi:hypothetical protein